MDFVIDPAKVIDLTAQFTNNKLTWDVPEGKWTIMRTAMLSTRVTNSPASPEGTGPEVDKMSKKHVARHFDAYIGEILRRIPPEDRTTFKVVVQDSYETGGQNWTDDMAERFEHTYGYNPVPFLPVLQGMVVGSPDISDRFLWDLRRLVADRVAYDYVGGLREISHQHGLTTWLENYGHWGFPGEFLQYGGQSDEIGGEFWSEGSLGDIENRAASSCAHIYGKRKVWAESFTSAGSNFSRYPYLMKQRGDRFFTEGINATLLHLFIHQPYEDRNPGINAWFGNDFNRKNTWFSQMHVFSEYLKRCNFMLQQGTYVADVAYFIGEDTPKMTGAIDPPLPHGYSFDYINAEVLMNAASVKDGKLTLNSGMQYSVLVLPDQKTMRPELLNKIAGFVEEGLILLGSAPECSPGLKNYPEADKEIKELANSLWGSEQTEIINYGKGRIYTRSNTLENIFFNERIHPDCFIEKTSADIRFIHRNLKDGEIYFLSNQDEKVNKFPVRFRVTDKQPELWNPVTGEIRYLPEFNMSDHTTTLNIELQPLESVFIVFRNKPDKKIQGQNHPDKNKITTLDTSWNVSFDGLIVPEDDITMKELYDLTQSDNPFIKYFSGTTIYSTSFSFNDTTDEELYIDLGKVMVMAKVWLNDEYVGGVWTYPYELNITDYIRQGENSLKIEVVNNWKNRLIGDLQLPEKQRSTWTFINPWTADSELQPSGLTGPVQLFSCKYRVLK